MTSEPFSEKRAANSLFQIYRSKNMENKITLLFRSLMRYAFTMEHPPGRDGSGEPLEVQPEHELVAYKEALTAAVRFHNTGENPFVDTKDPESLKLLEAVRAWETRVFSGSLNTEEGVDNVLRVATIWLDAGYKDPAAFRSALTTLWDAYGVAMNQGDSEGAATLGKRIAEFEQRMVIANPKEKLFVIVEQKISEAEDLMRQERFVSAIGTLAGMLILDPRFKKGRSAKCKNMTSEQQEKIEKMLANAETRRKK
jgi:hypothetical protein